MKGKADLPFTTSFWLGNEDRGMTWFAESQKGWKLKGNPTPLGVVAEADHTVLTVRFAVGEWKLEEPRTLTFGLIATPVKPMPAGWRTFRSHRDYGYFECWKGGFTQANNYITHPNPGWRELYYSIVGDLGGVSVIPYQRPDWINTREPEATYYRQEWETEPVQIFGSDSGDDKHLAVCLDSEWQDFMLYYAVKAFREMGNDGYYFDGGLPWYCRNEHHSCGWRDEEGHIRYTTPILAFRRFYKRLATALDLTGRSYFIKAHNSGCLEMPTLSFVSFVWDGEQFSHGQPWGGVAAAGAPGYVNIMTLAAFRAEFLGRQFGIPVHWLGFHTEAQADTMLLFSLAHGTGDLSAPHWGSVTWPAGYNLEVLNKQDAFGLREPDCSFSGYWENQACLSVEPAREDLVCSLWRRPGKVLLVLANLDAADQEAAVSLDRWSLKIRESLGVEVWHTGLTARDLMSGEAVALACALRCNARARHGLGTGRGTGPERNPTR